MKPLPISPLRNAVSMSGAIATTWNVRTESLPAIEYSPDDHVRKIQHKGEFSFQGRTWKVSKAFHGYPVSLRSGPQDGCYDVYFCQHKIALINLNDPQ